tara:strand:- start:577 stop:1203 length:627 start_codon:yes stop_codon:yes gene_type:complete
MAIVDIYNNTGAIDRTSGIKEVIKLIPNLASLECLDLFAGDGSFCSYILAQNTKNITCIAYNSEDAKSIQKNIPSANIIVTDALNATNFINPLDLVFCDNPQGILPNGTCEYFDYLKKVIPYIKSGGYLLHNINVNPYNYDKNGEWAKRRNDFYQKSSCENLDLDFVKHYHQNYIESKFNRKIKKIQFIPREKYKGNIYLYFILYQII